MQGKHSINAQAQILSCLPEALRTLVTEKDLLFSEELRLRAGARICLVKKGQSIPVAQTIVTPAQIAETVMRMCNHSVYAVMEQIKNGFMVLPGGVRVGLAGRVVAGGEDIENLKEFSGLNFRIPHEIVGCADKLLPQVLTHGRIRNTLLISPPGCGKTTLLRDLVRSLSVRGYKVCVIDERDEICAVHGGLPGFDVGDNTDILSLCPKKAGAQLAIRTLSPHVLVTDELWGTAQREVAQMAAGAGCAVIASVHGSGRSAQEEKSLFELFVTLGRKNGVGTLQEVYVRA